MWEGGLTHSFVLIWQVPFVLVEGGRWPQSDYVIVNIDGSRHALPLTTVYHQLQPIDASPYTFLQALFGHEYPVSSKEVNPKGAAFHVFKWIQCFLDI